MVLPFDTFSKVFKMANSFDLSKADVASSNNNIGGFFNIALAMHNLYFYPPDN